MRLKQMLATLRINKAFEASRTASTFSQQVQEFIAAARVLAGDGLTLAEVGQLFLALITLAVDAAARLSATGETKKSWVLSAVAQLYDAVAPHVPLPWFVAFLRPLIRPHLRALVLALADGVIEAVYQARQPDPPTK